MFSKLKIGNRSLARDSGPGPSMYNRRLPPAHYSLKIESFSLISKLDKYESGVFEAGGYKWHLSLYPNGDKANNGSGYISLYLSIEESSWPWRRDGWNVDVDYKLFVHDQKRDMYWTVQEADGGVSSFHGSKTQQGFPQFLSLEKFQKDSKGYLVNDSFTIGAEVFVIEPTKKRESLAMVRSPPGHTFACNIPNFSSLSGSHPYSKGFTAGEIKWELLVYPKGDAAQKGKSLSVYLQAQNLPPKKKVYAEFFLLVLDQRNQKHIEKKVNRWLCATHPKGGYEDFMPLKDLHKSANGFVYKDALTVKVQIRVLSTVSTL